MSNVITVVGHSGSGKTTLVEKLLRELTAKGVRVATIKHAHHKVVLDTPGKDSFRYKQAGAVMSMLVTSNEMPLVADAVDRRDRTIHTRPSQEMIADCTAIIMAGGDSRRMGTDKAGLLLDGQTLLQS